MPILFFGRLSHLSAAEPAERTDSETLRRRLAEMAPELGSPTVRIAVNGELAHGPVPVLPGDEIAFLPPMSGG